jgi:hypothetical protein
MQMRTTKNTPPVTVSLIALNTQTGRVERLVHVGRVNAPATARAMLALAHRAMKERKTRITF